VHAVVLFRGNRGSYLVTTIHGTMDVSLESVPRKCLLYGPVPGYISRTMTWEARKGKGGYREGVCHPESTQTFQKE
jgi:hypothetical protein